MKRKPWKAARRLAICPLCAKTMDTPETCPHCQAALAPHALPAAYPEGTPLAAVQSLTPGTRVRLSDGEVGELELVNHTRARFRLERPRVREFDARNLETGESKHIVAVSERYRETSPGAEVLVLQGPQG